MQPFNPAKAAGDITVDELWYIPRFANHLTFPEPVPLILLISDRRDITILCFVSNRNMSVLSSIIDVPPSIFGIHGRENRVS
jgi:hypothetical protein